jgi:hypothetical protein
VPIGTPSKDSPFSGTGTFVPHVIVRNLTAAAQAVTITIEYPGEDGPAQAALPPLPLEAYRTKDIPLDSVLGSLPLPLPFCSIRIQYSGPPGSVIGEVSSVESKGDLVIDSRLANEGDGWAGSGAHPWHLDDQTESVLFLTNMGDKDAEIGFRVQAEGVPYYLIDLSLKPHETKTIDLRKLRDAQKPDFQGNKIPAGATDGSVLWIRLQDVPVMGRLVVMQRHKGLASNYDCQYCICPPSIDSLSVSPSSYGLLPVQTHPYTSRATYKDCNGSSTYYDRTSNSTWSSNNTPVATVNDSAPKGLVTAVAGGSASIGATYVGILYMPNCQPPPCHVPCICYYPAKNGGGTADVVTISGPQTVWWFNGQNPSGYTTSIQLTANPAGQSQYTWAFSAGSDKATFSGQSGNTINLTGTALSVAPGADVKVKVTVTFSGGGSKTSSDYPITVRGPKKVVATGRIDDYSDSTYGYFSDVYYTIRDNLDQTFAQSIGLNEHWTSSAVPDAPFEGTNWRQGIAEGTTTSTSQFYDHMGGEAISLPAIPTPTGPCQPTRCTQKVQHWGQEWLVGSETVGAGARVQTDTLQKYKDHARHEGIVSPAP